MFMRAFFTCRYVDLTEHIYGRRSSYVGVKEYIYDEHKLVRGGLANRTCTSRFADTFRAHKGGTCGWRSHLVCMGLGNSFNVHGAGTWGLANTFMVDSAGMRSYRIHLW